MDLGLFSFRSLLLDLKRRQGLYPRWASCELELLSGVRTGRCRGGWRYPWERRARWGFEPSLNKAWVGAACVSPPRLPQRLLSRDDRRQARRS